jgi:hypothetical protein
MKHQAKTNKAFFYKERLPYLLIIIALMCIREISPFSCGYSITTMDYCAFQNYCFENTSSNYYACSNTPGTDKYIIGTAIYYYQCNPYSCPYNCYDMWGDFGPYCFNTCYNTCDHGTKYIQKDCDFRCSTCNGPNS